MTRPTDAAQVPTRRRRRARMAAIVALAGAGTLGAGYGAISPSAPVPHAAVLTSARRLHATHASKAARQATLPQCGATRDPFDPTDSAPAGPPGC